MSTTLHLLSRASANVRAILHDAIEYDSSTASALVIFDTESGLANILTEAYRAALPQATFLDFGSTTKEDIIAHIDACKPGNLVVMIQSMSFRLNDFRIRIHLFNRGLKVIEHGRLARNSEPTWGVYVDALAYDKDWYRGVGRALQVRLRTTKELRIVTESGEGEHVLTVTGGLEDPKPNLGDYTGMENIGGAFPIGEVFTEATDFAQMNGSVALYAFADTDFNIQEYPAFRVDISEGLVTGWSDDAPALFGEVIANIRANEEPLVREIGFGMNRAITKEHHMEDITAFERILGIHLSLGEKHSVYKKEGIAAHKSRFHVDVFPNITAVYADGELIFDGVTYIV